MKTAVAVAGSYFDSVQDVTRSQVIVFDIDETALSNVPVRFSASQAVLATFIICLH